MAQVTVIDSLEALLQQHKVNDTAKVNLLNKIASSHLEIYNYNKVLSNALEAQKLSVELNFTKGEALSLFYLGGYYRALRDYPQAIEQFQKSLILKESLGDSTGIAKNLNRMGIIYMNMGDYSKALEHLQKSVSIFEKLGDKEGIAINLNYFGIVYTQLGNYLLALEYHQKSLKMKEEYGDKKSISNSLNNIGVLYDKLGDYPMALDYYQRSMKIKEELDDTKGISIGLNNMGVILTYLGDYEKASEYHYKALAILEVINDKQAIASNFNNLGIISKLQGDYRKALEFHQKSLANYQAVGYKSGECFTYFCIGQVYLLTGQNELALENTNKSLEIANELKLLNNQNEGHDLLAKIYASKNDYKNAYINQLLHEKIKDNVFNEKNVKEILGIELKYKHEKEKELLYLEQQEKAALADNKLKHQKNIKNIIVFILIISAAITFLFIRLYRITKTINSLLVLKNHEIYKQREFISKQNIQLQTQADDLFEHKEHLEDIVKQRTKELTLAKERAEGSELLKTAFLNNISHEFRTPMNGILGFSALLMDTSLSLQEKEDCFESLKISSSRLLNMVNDTVELSKVHSGQISLCESNVEISDLIKRTIKDFEHTTREKNVKVKLNINLSPDQKYVQVDRFKLERVYWHIISNAIKFTFSGHIKTTVEIVGKNQMLFKIEDTGIGISKEFHEKIFEPFIQLDSGSTRSFEGSGIGLSLSKSYINMLGGKIWIDSQPDIGTTVYFTIPIVSKVTEEPNCASYTLGEINNKTILIAEDNALNYMLLHKVLANYNIKVLHAWNGAEAVEIFKSENTIDLVLMDLKMPVMDGYKATIEMKRINSKIPVIAQSAYAMDISKDEITEIGFDDYISKPINKEELIELIKRSLG
jgi:signal transduction histidine kinase/CheY-like chemotaxis protein/Flp pilus assembly protein TadD